VTGSAPTTETPPLVIPEVLYWEKWRKKTNKELTKQGSFGKWQ